METTPEVKVELTYDPENNFLRATTTFPDGRIHIMWYPSMEVYLEEQRFHRAADHKRFMAVIWDKQITMEEALKQIDEYEKSRPSVN